MVSIKDPKLVWMDLEMTGLDPRTCTILEIGVVVTDNDLNVLAEGPVIAIHHPDKVLASMEPWSRTHHRRSGLTEACRASTVSLKKAEDAVLDFLRRQCRSRSSPLCGNSIGQDRRFLVKHMPRLEAYLHYRNVDVSSVKELVQRWYPAAYHLPEIKGQGHRALADVLESIEELRFYREKVFVPAHARR